MTRSQNRPGAWLIDVTAPDHQISSACKGKHPYPSWSVASAALRRGQKAREAKGEDRVVLHVYRCPHCHRYHVGSPV